MTRARSVSPGSLRRSVPKAPTGRSPQCASLSATVGTAVQLADRGLTPAVAALVARDALDDVVTVNAPVVPSLQDVEAIVLGLA